MMAISNLNREDQMKVSLRKGTMNDRPAIFAYRPRERSNSIGYAFRADTGLWVVSISGRSLNAARDKAHACELLTSHFDAI